MKNGHTCSGMPFDYLRVQIACGAAHAIHHAGISCLVLQTARIAVSRVKEMRVNSFFIEGSFD